MGWLWWVLMAVLVGGLLWWLTTRTKPHEEVYDAPGVGRDGERGSASLATGATTAEATGTATSAPASAPAGSAPSADLDPAAAGIAAPAETDAETAPEATGAAPDEAGWAPTDPDQAAAEADVEVPSGAAPGAAAPAGTGAWAQDDADVAAGTETPVVSEASGAAAADVAPAEASAPVDDSMKTSGQHVTESLQPDPTGSSEGQTEASGAASAGGSGSTDVEFADASVAYEEPPADPSYTPTHLAPNARDTSVDPAAAPQATPAPETGAGEGFGGAAVGGTAEVSEGRYGPGSAEPLADGSSPGAAYTIKGNVESMRFHGPESPYYNRTTAEVWFADADAARTAGFTPWNEV